MRCYARGQHSGAASGAAFDGVRREQFVQRLFSGADLAYRKEDL